MCFGALIIDHREVYHLGEDIIYYLRYDTYVRT